MSGAGRPGELSDSLVAVGRLSRLPLAANNVANCNSLPFTQDPISSGDGVQHAVWVSGAERFPVVCRRELPDGAWSEPVDLCRFPGSPFEAQTGVDPHNSYALGIDARGRVHVAGNHHDEPLRYARSSVGGGWEAGAMIGEDEQRVTYPAFVRLPDGALLFLYRDGRSGSGDVYLNRLAAGADSWERVAMLVEGRGTGESPYLNHIAVEASGAVHISGCFRERSGSAASNRDVWHIQSDDGGLTWRSAAGEALELPVGHRTAPIAAATAPEGSGLVNQTGMDVDRAARPHISYLRYDARGATQIALASYDGERWSSRDVTRLFHRMRTDVPIVDASVARPAVACGVDGRVWVVFRAAHDGYRGRVCCVEATPGRPVGAAFALYAGDLGAWEPTIDSGALRTRGELHLLLTPAPPYEDRNRPDTFDAWTDREIGVLTVEAGDLSARADELA